MSIIAATKPETPSAPVLVSQSPTLIEISWTPPADGGSLISNYIILSDNAGGAFSPLSPTTNSGVITNYQISAISHSLQAGQIYAFKIVAVNEVDQSDPSDAVFIRAAKAPDAPINLAVIAASDSSITLQWDEPVFDGASTVFDYKVYWNGGIDNAPFALLSATTLGFK